MASTSSTSVIPARDASSQVLSPILEKLDEESLKKLEPFIPEIEEQLVRTIDGVSEKKIKNKSKKGLISAAIYDTFLHFERLTNVQIRTDFIAESLGIRSSVVNYTWRKLFDTRVSMDTSRIQYLSSKSTDPKRLITTVIQIMQGAVMEKSNGIEDWFSSVEAEAKDLLQTVTQERLAEYAPDAVAVAAVYDVINKQSKPLVSLSQRDASLVCGNSAALIYKVWHGLFSKGRISSTG